MSGDNADLTDGRGEQPTILDGLLGYKRVTDYRLWQESFNLLFTIFVGLISIAFFSNLLFGDIYGMIAYFDAFLGVSEVLQIMVGYLQSMVVSPPYTFFDVVTVGVLLGIGFSLARVVPRLILSWLLMVGEVAVNGVKVILKAVMNGIVYIEGH